MNFAVLREKTVSFLAPILVIGVVLGGAIALFGKAYFWDVSRLTIQIPGDKETTVTLQIQARIVYFDADIFGFYYPVHFTLPLTRTQKCMTQCVFDRLPAGDAELTVFSENGPQRTMIFITPDTDGTLDLRPPFQIIPLTDGKIWDVLRAPALTADEQKNLPDFAYSDAFSGLYFFRENNQYHLYDTLTRQSVVVPIAVSPIRMARGEAEGEYLFWTKNGLTRWDRYGRTPTETITELTFKNYIFTWSSNEQTTITHGDGKQSLGGIWLPIFSAKDTLITDGEKIMQLQ